MLVPASVEKRRLETALQVAHVADLVGNQVLSFCNSHGFAYSARSKASESLAEKIESGRFSRWSDLDDLFACTVVIPTLKDEACVLEFLRSSFVEKDCRLRGASKKDPEVFRFDSTRFIGSLSGNSDDDVTSSVLFEVQIRTAFEHAWSVTTHALAYKGGGVSWRSKRMAAQLRAAVEQLDQLVLGFQELSQVMAEQDWPEVRQKKAIGDFFGTQVEQGHIPTEMAPASWTRFSENVWNLLSKAGGGRRYLDARLLDAALEDMGAEIRRLGLERIPRSISLYQFLLGVLSNSGRVTRVQDCVLLITPELLSLYPNVQLVQAETFDFEFLA